MLLVLVALLGSAPAPQYPVAAIPASLREGAHAVVRANDEVVTIKSASRLVHTVHRVVTVLDESAADLGQQVVSYDALNRLSYLRGAVYDADGRLLHQLRAAEVHDRAASDLTGSLQTDLRIRHADLRQAQLPYTVEFEYELVSDNTLFYPTWQPQSEYSLAVQAASLRVNTLPALPLRYQERNWPAAAAVQRSSAAGQSVYTWQLANQPALEEEDASPAFDELAPAVALAPAAFEVQGHAGDASSWQGLGQWNYALNAGRGDLPAAAVAKVTAAVQGLTDVRSRVQRVYELLQGSTRYVSVQLGLGGWQTIPASAVAATGYGDCKALSNYTQALLLVAGVPAYLALVKAGEDQPDIRREFPNAQFNHVVLCVPPTGNLADTLWLECTSQTNPFGYMGRFTGNRHALLLKPTGGELVSTPRYGAAQNSVNRHLDLFLDATGSATATVRTLRTGLAHDDYHQLLHTLSPAEQKTYIRNRLALPTFTLGQCALTQVLTAQVPAVLEKMTLALPGLAPPSGSRFFISPNLLGRLPVPTPPIGERRAELWLPHASMHTDTVRLHLPATLRPETLPAPVELSSAFGRYSQQFRALPDGSIQLVRRLDLVRGRMPRTAYAAYLDFCRKVSQADKAQLVLRKAEG